MIDNKYLKARNGAAIDNHTSNATGAVMLGLLLIWCGATIALTVWLGWIGFAGALGITGAVMVWRAMRELRCATGLPEQEDEQ